jgi:uncharacterized protein YeaO (DUF488 family)
VGREDAVRVGRVYDAPSPGDGRRVLVDRLWPRGVRKDDPRIDEWLRDVAPSTGLRRWYGHEPSRFEEFAGRYAAELDGPAQAEALRALRELAAAGAVTLRRRPGNRRSATPRSSPASSPRRTGDEPDLGSTPCSASAE